VADTKTRPLSFRVSEDVLDALLAAGRSPADIARSALEREARLAKKQAALRRLAKNPTRAKLPMDAVSLVRSLRDRGE
jgi:hypothetical protein